MNTVELTSSKTEENASANSTWRDSLGIIASVGCAIHCAAMPFVIAYLPALGLSFLADESFHKWMALVCFLIAIMAFVPGLRKHGSWVPVSIGAIGLVLITFAAFGLAGECCASCAAVDSKTPSSSVVASVGSDVGLDRWNECESCGQCVHGTVTAVALEGDQEKDWLSVLAPWITPFGGMMLVAAHLLNRRCGSGCGCC